MATNEENNLARAVREFYALLDSMKWTGASQVAELAQLKLLIGKYPDNARNLVADLGEPHAGRG
jgi:hypothetical protein